MDNIEKSREIENNIIVFANAKRMVQNVIDSFKKLEKKTKKTKQSRKAIKLMEDFVKCNLTNPVIAEKYAKVIKMLIPYGKVGENENKNETNSGT
jgi:hypothetical protein